MLTYDMGLRESVPLYEYIYKCIKSDILSGKLEASSKLPSKRALSENLSVSVITVQNAYEQLLYEGYIISKPKRGYFVADIDPSMKPRIEASSSTSPKVENENVIEQPLVDFTTNIGAADYGASLFPFSTWTKLMRKTLLDKERDILKNIDGSGVTELKGEISNYLKQYRGIEACPSNIIIGAGMEYLYGLLVLLLGRTKMIAVEDPGHTKVHRIYENSGVKVIYVPVDDNGMNVDDISSTNISAIHISPSHHFPTGGVMPVSRRHRILGMARDTGCYIIEDDYDSEFRFAGRPISTMYAMDNKRVIYMNTFSKTLVGAVRMAYMVLPDDLLAKYKEQLGFYSGTVSKVEQYTLSRFIRDGYFERHISRMRLRYKKYRANFLDTLKQSRLSKISSVIENNAGLHFILKIAKDIDEKQLKEKLLEKRIKVGFVSDYSKRPYSNYRNMMIINYFDIETKMLQGAFNTIYECIE